MSTIYLSALELPKVLASHEKTLPKAIRAGIRLAAERGRSLLVRESPVDQGQYKNSWRIRETSDGPSIVNDAPHAGIIEKGARPHGVNREGIEALTAWALRKLMSGQLASKTPASDPAKKYRNQYGSWAGRQKRSKTPALEKEARGIAFAIAAKFKKYGQKGLFIVDRNMPKLSKFLAAEVARQIKQALDAKGL